MGLVQIREHVVRIRFVLAPILALFFASAASAGDWTRPGWYAGVGIGAGFNFFDKFLEDEFGFVTIDPAAAVNVRGGYRVWPWLALEGMYEATIESGIDIDDVSLPVDASANLTTHSFLANLKLILPIKRFQPFITVGPGAQYGVFKANVNDFDLLKFEQSRWDFTLRVSAGLDFYITENWVVDLELAPSVRFKDYSDIPSAPTDNVTMTLTGGVLYRF